MTLSPRAAAYLTAAQAVLLGRIGAATWAAAVGSGSDEVMLWMRMLQVGSAARSMSE